MTLLIRDLASSTNDDYRLTEGRGIGLGRGRVKGGVRVWEKGKKGVGEGYRRNVMKNCMVKDDVWRKRACNPLLTSFVDDANAHIMKSLSKELIMLM